MGYDGYDGYQSYDSYEYDPYRQQQGGGVPEQYEARPQYDGPQQYEQQYEQYGDQAQYGEQAQYTAQPQYEQQYQPQPPQPQYQDAQWAQSGLGWEQQAWDDARLGVAPLQELQEQGYAPYPESQYPESQYPESAYQQQYEQYEQYEQYDESADYGAAGLPRQRAAQPAARPADQYSDQYSDADADAEAGAASSPATVNSTATSGASAAASASAASAPSSAVPSGRGAFGAAGIGVLAAISALAGSGALVVVIALIQAGIAYGWQQAVTLRENGRPDRRAVVLTALVGWAAAASAFRLPINEDFIGLPVTLGVGFLLLAADQALRARPLGDGQRVAGLDLTVTGGLFAVLPAGFVVAERSDTALTAACALAAAIGVLCCALLGRNPLRGIVISFVLGAGIGAVAAQSLSAHGGLKAGALGGAVAALAAAAALGAVDRIAAEGGLRGSSRIVSQVLPSSLAAMGALFASAVFR